MVGYIEIIAIPLHTMQLALLDGIGYRDSVKTPLISFSFEVKY